MNNQIISIIIQESVYYGTIIRSPRFIRNLATNRNPLVPQSCKRYILGDVACS